MIPVSSTQVFTLFLKIKFFGTWIGLRAAPKMYGSKISSVNNFHCKSLNLYQRLSVEVYTTILQKDNYLPLQIFETNFKDL